MRVHWSRILSPRRTRTRQREMTRLARKKHPGVFLGPAAGARRIGRQEWEEQHGEQRPAA